MSLIDCLNAQPLQKILTVIPVGVLQFTYAGKILTANDRCAKLLGYTPEQMTAFNLDDLSHPTDLLPEKLERQKCWRGEIDSYAIEKRFRHRQGHLVWVGIHTLVVKDDQQEPQHLLSFWEDIHDRKEAEFAYIENEKKFRQIFEEVPVGMAIIGFNQRLVKVNQTLCQMLGYSEAELLSRSLPMLNHPEEDQQESLLAKQLYYGRIHHYQLEKRCLTKSQETIWVLHTAYAIRNERGKAINILAMMRDITKQKEAQNFLKMSLAEKELLLKEIHHRIKNNLHVIANLLDLQAQTIEDEQLIQILTESQNRIYAMSLIHEQLYQSPELSKVDFAQYLHHLIRNLLQCANLYPDTIELDITAESILLNLETAIPCGLIVNELIANTLKYAWRNMPLDTPKLIQVKFQHWEDHFALTIADNGIGLPSQREQSAGSLGLHLVQLLVKQLDGKMEISTEQGTRIKITFRELTSYARQSFTG
ncbi:MAG: PAS domain S-box protein [Pseudanabaenaceae cyanobacterium]